jgi:hypothetical protein
MTSHTDNLPPADETPKPAPQQQARFVEPTGSYKELLELQRRQQQQQQTQL